MIRQIQDTSQIQSILQYFKNDLHSLENGIVSIPDYSQKIYENGNLCVFCQDHVDKGFAAYYKNDMQSFVAFLSMIAVKEKYRNEQIGSKVLAYVEEDAKSAGMKVIKLEVSKENPIAVKFYFKHGYSPCEERESSWIYEKILEEGV